MTAVASLVEVIGKRKQEGDAGIIAELEYLLNRAKAGEFEGLCYSVITSDGRQTLSGYVKLSGCGLHELIGASVLLTDYLLRQKASG